MMNTRPTASHFVHGAPLEDKAGAAMPVLYPATGEEIALVHAATDAVIAKAVESAEAGFAAWAATPPAERGRVLRRAADIIRARNEDLSALETRDTGKPIQETLVADWASGANALEWFGTLAAGIGGEHVDLGGDFFYTRREPLGVCFGIGAWNYPAQIACWKAAPALACGNAMIFKPSEMTPLGALKLAEILVEAGLPRGAFNVVQGAGDVGAALTAHPAIAKVSVTGSVPTGGKVYAGAAGGLKPVTLELGGKSPILVFEDADLDAAVGGAMMGNFYSAGQVCSNGTRVFVQRAVLPEFLARLKARSEAMAIGDPADSATVMGPLISAAQGEKVMGYIAAGRAEGARLVTGGERVSVAGCEGGFFVQPTVFADVTDAMIIAREEIFGPVMAVLAFDDEEEALARANSTPFGLAAGVFTRDIGRAHRCVARLRAGTTWINAYNLTPVEMPFGGVKASGIGRENGRAALEHYSQLKSVYVGTGPVEAPF